MPAPDETPILSTDMLTRIRAFALEQVALMDELESALIANNMQRIIDLAWQIVDLQKQVKESLGHNASAR